MRPTRAHPRSRLLPTSTKHVAITGAIGAGKSAALEAFARHGAATISSDEIVHRLLRSDPEVRRELVERFGPQVVGSNGSYRHAQGKHDAQGAKRFLHKRGVSQGSGAGLPASASRRAARW